MTTHLDINDPRYQQAAAELLRRHSLYEAEANITSAIRDFLLSTGLAQPDQIEEEHAPASGSAQAVDLVALDMFIEVKRRIGSLSGFQPNPEYVDQLDNYLEQAHAQGDPGRMGILTDGKYWLLRWAAAGPVRTVYPYGFVLENAEQWFRLFEWLRDKALVAFEGQIPTRETIKNHFGLESPAWEREVGVLRALKRDASLSPAHERTVGVKQRLWEALLKTALGELTSSEEELDDLFIRHTHLSITTGLIVQASFGIDIRAAAETDPADLLRGQRFRNETGIQGIMESDFFAWPAEVGGETVIRDIARRVARFDWLQAPPDIAAILYETVIPADERWQLGEYYTPHWLARSIIQELVDNPLEQHVLDPSCGSGTFIAEAIAHFVTAARQAQLPPQEALRKLRMSVTGIDVHPAAVHLARSAWALAAKPLIDDVVKTGADASLSVPVYLGDSLLLRLRVGDMIAESEIRIPVEDDTNTTLIFPRSLVDRADEFDRLMNAVASAIEAGEDPVSPLSRYGLKPRERAVMERTIATMRRLHDEGRNHIWAYYTRNLIRPLTLTRNRVDTIVGNPPWLNYRNTANVLRSELERQSKVEYDLWAGGRYASNQDVAGLFYARCVDLYLKDGGVIGMVMPHSALQTGQYTKWRTGQWRSTSGGKGFTRILAVQFSYKTAWDLERLQPNNFFPVPASVVFAQRTGENAKASPLAGVVERWLGKAGAPDVRRESVAITDTSAGGISPYGGWAREGAAVYPRRLLFVEEAPSTTIVQATPLVTVRPREGTQDKEPWRSLDLSVITGVSVESTYLFDLHLGETVVPYATLSPLKALLPIKHGDNELPTSPVGIGGIDITTLEQRMRGRWRIISTLWEEHKASANRLDLLGQLDYYGKLSAQLEWQRNPGERPFRIAYTANGEPTAAFLDDDTTLVDKNLYWVTCESISEVYYLLAIINSQTLYDAVAPLMPKGLFGARHLQKHLWKLPIPAFEPGDGIHAAIAEAGAVAAVGAARLLDKLNEERGEEVTTRYARSELRKWLANSHEGHAVEEAVGRLLHVQRKAAYADKTHDSVEAEDAALSRAIAEGLKKEPASIEEAKKVLRETDGD